MSQVVQVKTVQTMLDQEVVAAKLLPKGGYVCMVPHGGRNGMWHPKRVFFSVLSAEQWFQEQLARARVFIVRNGTAKLCFAK